MASHRDPLFELRNVTCSNGNVTGELRNLKKRYNFHRYVRVRANEPTGRFWRPVQDSHSGAIMFPAEDTNTWHPFALNITRRTQGGDRVQIRTVGQGRAVVQEIDACGPARGPSWWFGLNSWWRR